MAGPGAAEAFGAERSWPPIPPSVRAELQKKKKVSWSPASTSGPGSSTAHPTEARPAHRALQAAEAGGPARRPRGGGATTIGDGAHDGPGWKAIDLPSGKTGRDRVRPPRGAHARRATSVYYFDEAGGRVRSPTWLEEGLTKPSQLPASASSNRRWSRRRSALRLLIGGDRDGKPDRPARMTARRGAGGSSTSTAPGTGPADLRRRAARRPPRSRP